MSTFGFARAVLLLFLAFAFAPSLRADVLIEYLGPPLKRIRGDWAPPSAPERVAFKATISDDAWGPSRTVAQIAGSDRGPTAKLKHAILVAGSSEYDISKGAELEVNIETDSSGRISSWQVCTAGGYWGGVFKTGVCMFGPGSVRGGQGHEFIPSETACNAVDMVQRTDRTVQPLGQAPRMYVLMGCGVGLWTVKLTSPPPKDERPDCPRERFETMLQSTRELHEVARLVATDSQYFANAVLEVASLGRRSPFANLAVDILEEDFTNSLTGEPPKLEVFRKQVVDAIRSKADFRESLGYTGKFWEPGRVPTTPGITAEVIRYFCTLDPEAMTPESWTALWRAGYVDFDLYKTVETQMMVKHYLEVALQVAETATDLFDLAALGLWSQAKKRIQTRAGEFAAYLAGRVTMKALATRQLPSLADARAVGVQARAVLGKWKMFDGYVATANKLRAMRFKVPERLWESWTESQRWLHNQRFLDWCIQEGVEIVLDAPLARIEDADGVYRRELEYLRSKGLRLSPDGARMLRW